MEQGIEHILTQKSLRITDCRKQVLKFFLSEQKALSHADLENFVRDTFDRVTLYRTLNTFLEHDIIHKVLDSEGACKYAYCNHDHHIAHHHHSHDHVHFKCQSCGNTTCLNDVYIPLLHLPVTFQVNEKFLLLHGICDKCNTAQV